MAKRDPAPSSANDPAAPAKPSPDCPPANDSTPAAFHEIEGKYIVDNGQLLDQVAATLLAEGHSLKKTSRTISLYHDTKDQLLFNRGTTLRTRYGSFDYTTEIAIKHKIAACDGIDVREEYENDITPGLVVPDLKLIANPAARKLVADIAQKDMCEYFITDVDRRTFVVQLALAGGKRAVLEVALDHCHYVARTKDHGGPVGFDASGQIANGQLIGKRHEIEIEFCQNKSDCGVTEKAAYALIRQFEQKIRAICPAMVPAGCKASAGFKLFADQKLTPGRSMSPDDKRQRPSAIVPYPAPSYKG